MEKNWRLFVRPCHSWLLGLSLLLFGCSDHHDAGTASTSDDEEVTTGYADGTYCAQVGYYYAASGTNSTYTLLVDVEDNRLIKIHWPNGGWLDETHYSGPDIEDGDASFTSDAGVDYTVHIEGEEGSCSTSTYAVGEEAVIQEHEDQAHRRQEAIDIQEQTSQQDEEDRRQRQQAEEEQEAAQREREQTAQRAQQEQEEQEHADASDDE